MRVLLSAAVHLSAMMRMLTVHRAAGCEQHCALSQSNLKCSAAIMMWRAAHLDALRYIQHADGAQIKAITDQTLAMRELHGGAAHGMLRESKIYMCSAGSTVRNRVATHRASSVRWQVTSAQTAGVAAVVRPILSNG